MTKKDQIRLVARFLIEDNSEEKIDFDPKRKNKKIVLKSIVRNMFSTLKVDTWKTSKRRFDNISRVLKESKNSFNISLSQFATENTISMKHFQEALKMANLDLDDEEKSLLILHLIDASNSTSVLKYQLIFEIFTEENSALLFDIDPENGSERKFKQGKLAEQVNHQKSNANFERDKSEKKGPGRKEGTRESNLGIKQPKQGTETSKRHKTDIRSTENIRDNKPNKSTLPQSTEKLTIQSIDDLNKNDNSIENKKNDPSKPKSTDSEKEKSIKQNIDKDSQRLKTESAGIDEISADRLLDNKFDLKKVESRPLTPKSESLKEEFQKKPAEVEKLPSEKSSLKEIESSAKHNEKDDKADSIKKEKAKDDIDDFFNDEKRSRSNDNDSHGKKDKKEKKDKKKEKKEKKSKKGDSEDDNKDKKDKKDKNDKKSKEDDDVFFDNNDADKFNQDEDPFEAFEKNNEEENNNKKDKEESFEGFGDQNEKSKNEFEDEFDGDKFENEDEQKYKVPEDEFSQSQKSIEKGRENTFPKFNKDSKESSQKGVEESSGDLLLSNDEDMPEPKIIEDKTATFNNLEFSKKIEIEEGIKADIPVREDSDDGPMFSLSKDDKPPTITVIKTEKFNDEEFTKKIEIEEGIKADIPVSSNDWSDDKIMFSLEKNVPPPTISIITTEKYNYDDEVKRIYELDKIKAAEVVKGAMGNIFKFITSVAKDDKNTGENMKAEVEDPNVLGEAHEVDEQGRATTPVRLKQHGFQINLSNVNTFTDPKIMDKKDHPDSNSNSQKNIKDEKKDIDNNEKSQPAKNDEFVDDFFEEEGNKEKKEEIKESIILGDSNGSDEDDLINNMISGKNDNDKDFEDDF